MPQRKKAGKILLRRHLISERDLGPVESGQGQGETMYRGPKVLVVDDDDAVRSLVAVMLDGYASEIQGAGSVDSAVCCLAQHDFDVVVCDMYMPEAHGLELIKKINEQQRDVAFVVMTGGPDLPDVIAALRLQAAGFLEKPFSKAQLVDVLEPVYRAIRNQRRLAERVTMLSSEVKKKSAQLQEALSNLKITERSSLETLVAALDAREHETCAHSFRVRAYTSHLAKQMNYPRELMAELECAALLHDVGKISVPDSILLKPGPLTAEEFEQCKTHAAAGARILSSAPSLRGVAEIVRHHHEQWDGRGYPDHLEGETIPLGARLFTIADTLDAIISDRCYRPANSFVAAKNEIVRCSGTQFDPAAVEAFLGVPEEQWLELRVTAEEEFSLRTSLPNRCGIGDSQLQHCQD
jgi:putative nucleotidyltransferase with HDIG domain